MRPLPLLAVSMIAVLITAACGGETAPVTTTKPATETVTAPSSSTTPPPATDGVTFDAAGVAAAWSAGDVEAVRAHYTDDALLVFLDEIPDLYRPGAIDPFVAHDAFAGRVAMITAGGTVGTVGEAVVSGDTTGYFAFTVDGGDTPRSGVSLVRLEGGLIWLQVVAFAGGAGEPAPVDETGLLRAWDAGTVAGVEALYAGGAVVANDRQVVEAVVQPDLTPPADLAFAVGELAPLPPGEQRGAGLAVGDLSAFPWGLSGLTPPAGEGVRLLRRRDGVITDDIRFVVRPWEADGQTLEWGYGFPRPAP